MVKITKGFLAVKPDGTFIRIDTYQTHTGTRSDFNDAKSEDDATFLYVPNLRTFGLSARLPAGVTFVPAELRREVVVKGYGVVK